MDWHWKRIILVPLVQGRSLERQALPNMNGVMHPLSDDLATQAWRLFPENIPEKAWDELGLAAWAPKDTWKVFDRFAGAYGALFHHVDHVADISRCEVKLDEYGEDVLRRYLAVEQERASPFLQETFDACAAVCNAISDLNDDDWVKRPNMVDCMRLVIGMKHAIYPKEEHNGESRLSLDEIVEWRNRMKEALSLLGTARYLWIADSLGHPGFDCIDDSEHAP